MDQVIVKPDQIISALNGLIEVNRDGQKGFLEAAEKMQAAELKTFCLEQSRSRAHFVGELQPLVQTMGEEPENTGTIAGAMHRGWIDLKTALGGGDHAILAATETGEDHAIKTYQSALEEHLPAPAREIVERQLQSIKQAHAKVKTLRDSLAK